MENKINKILAKVRPYVQMHGGDVQLLEVKNGVVFLQIFGSCVGCALADMTYNKMIGGLLKQEIPGIKKVVIKS
ncbi:MAG: NifU family protein [Candidatus Liptonbacteria bacterium]|nr:NifU family protein [Candidatus Liptonbacteria bacterium]